MSDDETQDRRDEVSLRLHNFADLATMDGRIYSFTWNPQTGEEVRLADLGIREGLRGILIVYWFALAIITAILLRIPGIGDVMRLFGFLPMPGIVYLLGWSLGLTYVFARFEPDGMPLHTWLGNNAVNFYEAYFRRHRYWVFRDPIEGRVDPVFTDEQDASISPDSQFPRRLEGKIIGPGRITSRDPVVLMPSRKEGVLELKVDRLHGRTDVYVDHDTTVYVPRQESN